MNVSIEDEIIRHLDQVEVDENVKIIYACESGSRAWGFPSSNSDYDVRFLYVRPYDWYLSIDLEKKRDVIELPVDNLLDISGWDLRKALNLLRKSNPPLLEWLQSPTIYKEESDIVERLRNLIPRFYSSKSCCYHYLSMARNNYREYLRGEEVRTKKYFYVLRPILAAKWIIEGFGVVPMEFRILVDRLIASKELKKAIYNLLELKRLGEELDTGPRIPIINDFIEKELKEIEKCAPEDRGEKESVDTLNIFFRESLDTVWKAKE